MCKNEKYGVQNERDYIQRMARAACGGGRMTKRKIKTVNRISNYQTEELMINDKTEEVDLDSELCSTEIWHKMNMAYLEIEMTAYSNRRWS